MNWLVNGHDGNSFDMNWFSNGHDGSSFVMNRIVNLPMGTKKKIDNYEGKGKDKSKVVDLGPKKCGVKKQVFPIKGKCYNCGDLGHRADKCNAPKQDHAHMVEDDMLLLP
ncbi:hypothetical protein E3N88_19813 [Mikania micrantha]|uniref:CCHC-type domain-containing protein n=1 Tax=Mikania micrantha TaxID=192012 RepID=A0A5N6NSE0_9ASTR|nr:hypothetical protein E3N88_19813 [Mikania micrantha]